MYSMYEILLQLPIFQGLSYAQLTEIIEKIPFSFSRFTPGQDIHGAGELCDKVMFVLSGTVRQTTPTYGGRIQIVQDFQGPYTLSFYNLFGAETHSISDLKALTLVGLMQVEKVHFLQMLQHNRVMLVNVLNMLSTHAQKQHVAMEFTGQEDPILRLASWLLAFTDRKSATTAVIAQSDVWQSLLRLDETSFQRCVAVLEGRGCVEMEGTILKLIDRYALRRFVGEKTVPKW